MCVAAGWFCSVSVHAVLAVSSYNTVVVLLLLHVLWKNIKSQSVPSSSCSLQLLLSWSSWPWWPSVTLQSPNAWTKKSSTKLRLQVYPTFKWNTQCYYSVCLFTHSHLRSSKFTRRCLWRSVLSDFHFQHLPGCKKNESIASAEWIYGDNNHYSWRHEGFHWDKYTNNSLIPKSIVRWYIMEQHGWAACFCLFEAPMAQWSLAVVLTHASQQQLKIEKNELSTHVAVI